MSGSRAGWAGAAILLFGFEVLVIMAEFHAVPGMTSYTFVDDHPGVVLLAGLALLVLSAGPLVVNAPHSTAWIGGALPALALVQAVALIGILDQDLTDLADSTGNLAFLDSTLVRYVILVVAAIVLLAVVGKLILLGRYAGLARTDRAESEQKLLPFQRRALESLADMVAGGDVRSQGQIVQLAGRWGEGKSVLLHHLQEALNAEERGTIGPGFPRRYAVAIADVWKYESEPDLHFAIYERVLAHGELLSRLAWLRLPIALVPSALASTLHRDFAARVGAKAGTVEVRLRLPRLLWQRAFERSVARLWNARCATVVVLDEIDRAAPEVAQAAVTMCRRSLDRPGVVIVLAYVRALMNHKVFNPLLPTLADLASTMDAVIADELYGAPLTVPAQIGEPDDSMAAVETRLLALESSRPKAARTRSARPDSTQTAGNAPTTVSQVLCRVYSRLGRSQRARLQDRFSEKYLGRDAVTLRPPTGFDVVDLVQRPHHALIVHRLSPTFMSGTSIPSGVAQQLGNAIDRWMGARQQGTGNRMPPLRALDAELSRLLNERRDRADGYLSTTSVIATVVAAVDAASYRSQPGVISG